MAKILSCRDFGADCTYTARGQNEEEILKLIREHGLKIHSMTDKDFSPEMLAKAKSLIRDE